MNTNRTIREMMIGLEKLDDYWANRKLSINELLDEKLSFATVLLLKYTYRPIRLLVKRKFDITEGLKPPWPST